MQINLDDTIIASFKNSPDAFTRYEEHDLGYLRQKLAAVPKLTKSDEQLITEAIKNAVDENNGSKIPYVFEKSASRFATKSALLGLSKLLKHDVYKHDGYQSLDIVNRNYSIILGIAKQNNASFPTIEKFVDNYKQYFVDYATYWGDKDLVKPGFANLVAHPVHKATETPFIRELVDELEIVQKSFKHPELPTFTVMQIIELYSTVIIGHVYDYLVEHEIIKNEHCALGNNVIYFKPLKEFSKAAVEEYIFKKTNLRIFLH